VLVQVLNIVIDNINDMSRRATNVINNIRSLVGGSPLEAFQINNVANPLQDQMDKLTDAFGTGNKSARAAFRSGMASHRRSRILEDAGDPDKGRTKRGRERKSDEERDYDSAVKGAEAYIKALQKETEEMGKNRIEAKQLATEREINELQAAATALGTAEAMQKARNLTLQMTQAQYEWEKAVRATALRDYRIELTDLAEAEEFETSLIGLNHEAREKAMAQRQIDLKLRALERDGIHLTAEEIEDETRRILANAAARGHRADIVDAANRAATSTRDMADAVRDATESFGDLFGTAGEGYANLLNVIFDFNARQEEGYARLAELQEEYLSGQRDITDYTFERRRVEDEMAQAQIANYGNMIHAAKTFFKEGSTGWKILEAAERVYRLFQFAMMIRSMFLDKTSTASSVANSGARAAADGVAAVAKAIASLPFPLNIAAGAATLAFLVAIGVKMMGKGGGKSASAAAKTAVDKPEEWMGPRDKYGNPTSYYSVLQPGQTTVTGTGNPGNFNSGPGPGMGSVAIGGTTLIVQGSLDSATLPQVQAMLETSKQETVQQARVAVSADIAEQSRRYRTG
jgi:hypothetical protein